MSKEYLEKIAKIINEGFIDIEEKVKPPIYKGALKMFPLALAEIAYISEKGSKKWGWKLSKQKDFRDSTARHLMNNELSSAAWNALAALEKELQNIKPMKDNTSIVYACPTIEFIHHMMLKND